MDISIICSHLEKANPLELLKCLMIFRFHVYQSRDILALDILSLAEEI